MATFRKGEADKATRDANAREHSRIGGKESSSKIACQYGTAAKSVPPCGTHLVGSNRVMRSEAIARKPASVWRMALEVMPRRRRPSGRMLISIGLVAALPFVFPVMLQRFVDQLLYYPMRYPDGDWSSQQQAGAEDVWLTSRDGLKLNAWWFPEPAARYATLFLHGNAGNVTHRVDHALAAKQAGSAMLVLDYRGYGKSEGRPSERGLYQDADAGYEELIRRGYPAERIILHGESLGTAVATELASRRACAALILEAPLASLSRMAGQVIPIVGPVLARGFDTERRIQAIHVPLLVIHGDADEIVPFVQGRAVYQNANEPKSFWRVTGAGHNNLLLVAGSEYPNQLRAFYASIGP
ncbi:MAG: alpha/beta hydrolase [Bryobacteraceae bacterium]